MDMSYENRFGHRNANYDEIDLEDLSDDQKKILFRLVIFLLFWGLFGFIAFIMSIVCFGRSGSIEEKIIGLLLAIFLGPFYFLFYGFNKGYCR